MTPIRVHGRRALLNEPGHHSTAAIVAEVEDTSKWSAGRDREGKPISTAYACQPTVMFQIANCDRSLLFTFGIDDDGEEENNLHKLRTLIDVLQEFETGLLVEQERYKKRKAALEKKRKTKQNKKARERRRRATAD